MSHLTSRSLDDELNATNHALEQLGIPVVSDNQGYADPVGQLVHEQASSETMQVAAAESPNYVGQALWAAVALGAVVMMFV